MSSFDIALKITLKNEGGFVNDPHDSGGETKYGISKRSYPELDIKNLTLDQAKEIYRNGYWVPIKGDEIDSQDLANKVFDVAVNIGCFHSIKCLQMALYDLGNEFNIDGKMGEKTIFYTNNYDATILLHKFREEVEKYYESLNNPRYLKGWLSRLYS
jgi:lysozyme family protein